MVKLSLGLWPRQILNHRIYFNTLGALDFLNKLGHGITLDNYANLSNLAFDLNSTQEASHDFIHPELTNCSISVQIAIDGALAVNEEFLFLGKTSSTFYGNSERKVAKNSVITSPPMNSDEIRYLLGKCIQLKFCLYGVFAADNFPKLTTEGFIWVIASPA